MYCLSKKAAKRHIATPRRFDASSQQLHDSDFQYRLLPPGESFRQAFERDHACSSSAVRAKWKFDRTDEIQRMRPYRTLYGVEGMRGYGVFFFKKTLRVVLESPKEFDATYVLSENWRQMVCLSKTEIRREYPDDYERVLHTENGWRERVERALCFK
jgi:hypothetical protein